MADFSLPFSHLSKMVQTVFRLIKHIDTFKEVLIFSLLGTSCLALYFGYRVIQSDEIISSFTHVPSIIEYRHPCYLRKLREDFYSVGIDFPVREDLRNKVKRHTQAFIIDHQPSPEEFSNFCVGLQESILDNRIESWLAPLQKPSVYH